MKKYIFPIVFSIFVTLILFLPYFREGKVPLPIDIPVGTYFPWLTESFGYPVHPPVKNPILTDTVSQFWIWRNWAFEGLKMGEIKLWNPYSLSGYALAPWFHTVIFSPLNIFYVFFKEIDAMSLIIISQIPIGIIGMYTLSKKWFTSSLAATVTSIIWTFSTFFVGWLTWGTVSFSLALTPFIVFSIDKLFESESNIRWTVLLTILFTSLILSGHPQTILYIFGIIFLYIVLTLKETKRYKKLIPMLISFVLTTILVSPSLLPSFHILKNSIRFDDPFLAENNYGFIPWEKLLIKIVSTNFFGNPATYNQWGGQPNYQESLVSFGLLGLMLSITGVILTIKARKKRQDIFLLLCFLGGFLLVTKFPLGILPYKLQIPLFSTIPAGRGFIISIFAGSLLAGKTISVWQMKKIYKEILIAIICIFSLFAPIALYFVIKDSTHFMIAARNTIVSTIFLFMGLAALLIGSKVSLTKKYLSGLLVLFLFLEGYVFFTKYTPFVNKNLYFPKTDTLQFLEEKQKESQDFFRIEREAGEILPANMWHHYGFYSPSGYDPVYPLSYSRFLIQQKAQDVPRRFVDLGNRNLYTNEELGVKYILVLKRDNDRKLDSNGNIPAWIDDNWKKVFTKDEVVVLENINFTPPYFLENSENTNVTLLEKQDEYWKFKIVTKEPNTFILIENTDPNWSAYIDEKKSEIKTYKNTFKSVEIESGTHTVEFVYEYSFLLQLVRVFKED